MEPLPPDRFGRTEAALGGGGGGDGGEREAGDDRAARALSAQRAQADFKVVALMDHMLDLDYG